TRLRHFYSGTQDERRLRELDLLVAHLDFCRGRFDDARRSAAAVLRDETLYPQIREAASLIVDEIDRIEGIDSPLRSTGRTRNRLGQWHELGSLPRTAPAELDRIAVTGETDWIACSDRELLFLNGVERWSADSREAIAALFRIRSEHHRLQRVVAQDEAVNASAPAAAIEG